MFLSASCQRCRSRCLRLNINTPRWDCRWSPMADVAHAWVLRSIQSFQYPRLCRKIQNSLISSGRLEWGAPVRPQSHQQSHLSPKPCDQWGFVQPFSHSESQFSSVLKCLVFSSKSSNLTCGNYLSYMPGWFLWCLFLCYLKIRLKEDKSHDFRISFLT